MKYRIPKQHQLYLPQQACTRRPRSYSHWLPAQNKEGFCPLSQESGELVYQNMFDLVCLLYPNADPNAVNARLNENLLILITGDSERIEQDFWRTGCFYFWDIMPFRRL
jgi:hypothetical protein